MAHRTSLIEKKAMIYSGLL